MNSCLPFPLLLLSVALAALASPAHALPPDRAAKAKECENLRMKYAASTAYNPYDDAVSEIRVQCSEAMFNKDFARAIELAERGLRRDPYNIPLLIVEASAYRATGDTAKADEARARWFGLMDSILEAGDGLSYATAFRVISIDEEDAVLRALQLTSTEKRSVQRRGVEYDVLQARDTQTGENREVYFNVDLPKKWQARQTARRETPGGPARAP